MDAQLTGAALIQTKAEEPEKAVLKARRMLDALQKLREKHSLTGIPERDAEAFYLDRRIQEYREDLGRAQSAKNGSR